MLDRSVFLVADPLKFTVDVDVHEMRQCGVSHRSHQFIGVFLDDVQQSFYHGRPGVSAYATDHHHDSPTKARGLGSQQVHGQRLGSGVSKLGQGSDRAIDDHRVFVAKQANQLPDGASERMQRPGRPRPSAS